MTAGAHPEPRAMLVTDLDGTLLDMRHVLSEVNRASLAELRAAGVLRVIATGRSLYSARKVVTPDFPVDYLVFSSGAGIVRWPSGELVHAAEMEPDGVAAAVRVLVEARLDFMIQAVVPDTHRFFHAAASGRPNPDFERRIERYGEFATPYSPGADALPRASHLVAIERPEAPARYEEVRRALAPLHVVRTTSPLDHRSRWIEVYPARVGKSFASERLRVRYGVPRAAVAAVGNDFNDEDLLAWAARGYVVANAPSDLTNRYTVVRSNDESGVAEVAGALLGALTSG